MPLPIVAVFADLTDPRVDTANKRHALTDILAVALCAVVSGCDTWEQIAEYGRRKEAFFRRFLKLPNGVPSHDTFYRVLSALDPAAFSERVGRWMASACEGTGLTPVAVDGKCLRSAEADNATGCLNVVSAWAGANRLTLGQVTVPDGTNETGAIPALLEVLHLKGAIVTIDAAGCQASNAAAVVAKGGHYLLAVKRNRRKLGDAVAAVFDRACEAEFAGVRTDAHESEESGHGRAERRHVRVVYDPAGLPAGWEGARAVVMVGREREVGGAVECSTHYYVTSHAGTAEELGGLIRGHWGIENGLHWVLDVAFGEDGSRTRDRNGASNLALLRRVSVSLLRAAGAKGSVKTLRLAAGWDDDFLLRVLGAVPVMHSA